ncbi:nucleoside hydrolase [Allomesorhizobium camelthorni]|uniref:Uncharacterized protein n=1 Tax=Allomesorhizobium camelthorni TaxID=475069 RepID=A0A6G4WFW4_9HYPH|nr:nucleoside hydrolase [Mesorhizobium camelthorni]NGO53484.1 hypothetical protein [Mesorhizobium camelthorni]
MEHFLNGPCRFAYHPVLIVTDVTTSGEIDDSVSLMMYRELERRGCIRIVGVVSIFGNGGASAKEVYRNLHDRLHQLGLSAWAVLEGPARRMSFSQSLPPTAEDQQRLFAIAAIVNQHERVVIAELGPFTVSARLLSEGLVRPKRIERILGVGGRAPGERFSTGHGLPFSFRDMNVDEDQAAVWYLLKHHPRKLWLVTYQTGINERMLTPETIAALGISEISAHAKRRAKRLTLIGYGGKIPAWDTWTTSYFIEGGSQKLSCRQQKVRLVYVPVDTGEVERRQLWVSDRFDHDFRWVEMCWCADSLKENKQ